jgi:protein involved in polysaccharide export with SLBB domain
MTRFAFSLWLATPVLISSLVVMSAQGQRLSAAENHEQTDLPQSGQADGASKVALTGERHPPYRLHKSDVVELSFAFAPEFHQIVTVQPDGYISLKQAPQIYVEGMTMAQLQQALTTSYSAFLHDPMITVSLKEFDKPYFIASGEVGHPGKYELRSETTVTEALAIAGGITNQARHSQVLLFRRVSDEVSEARVINVKHMLNSRDLSEDVFLHPGDLLYVPQSTISKIRRYLPTSNLGAYWNPAQF